MTAISVDPSIKRLTQVSRYARNNRVPDSSFQNELIGLANSAAAYRGKDIFRSVGSIANTPGSSGGTRTRHRFAFHTGPYCYLIAAHFVMAPLLDGAQDSGYSQLTITTTGGGAVGSAKKYAPISPGGPASTSDVPNNFVTGTVYVSVSADTDYLGSIIDGDFGRCLSVDVFEILLAPDTGSGFLDSNVVGNGPIYSTDREDIMPIGDAIWRRGASSLINWCSEVDSAARVIVATTADKNVVDNSSATVATSTPGYTLDLTGKATVASGGVPVVFTAYGAQSGGLANGSGVKLKDSSGTTLADIHPGTGANAWFSTTLLLPATKAKYDLQHYATATGGTFTLYAISLYEYLT